MAIIKLSAIERRRLSAFITCLVVAVLAWLFTALGNPYKYTVKQVVTYKNAPKKRAFHALQSDTVDATVQGTGWQMLFSRINNDHLPIVVDLHTLETRDYVVLSAQLKQINLKKQVNREIITINPDTLFFDFSNRTVKRVPVKLVSVIKYQKQFAQSGNVVLQPAYVTVSGPADVIQGIKYWQTDSVKLSDINESYSSRVSLKPSPEGNLDIKPKSVRVNIPIDEFTEKTMSISVKLINNRHYYDVKVFPQKVKITFTTSLTDYGDINEDDFEVVADLDNWKQNGYSVLPVKVTHAPSFSKIVKIEPQVVDFIVKK
ncbi:YbbR-like domain-containing protein [Mucilaginibacter pallidiroseus]|uniref:YbbR-like domain-containing protein n=1 Tax=Mucilaginibacter pallidiroseus TaxID=2599295 RepID=A0A563UDM5_9SPHI|nr:YbbR-like domain-containing protein [Mucilaginibacter pallidiroseus]TWR29465.1 YbbR-like domain-containing protein [Mucilaginibacter pallidiroseus]